MKTWMPILSLSRLWTLHIQGRKLFAKIRFLKINTYFYIFKLWLLGWPSYLDCDNTSVFTPEISTKACENDEINSLRGPLKFLEDGECFEPYFNKTSEPLAYYEDIKGCGLSCQDPSFKSTELEQIKGTKKIFYPFIFILDLFFAVSFWFLAKRTKPEKVTERDDNWTFFLMCLLRYHSYIT